MDFSVSNLPKPTFEAHITNLKSPRITKRSKLNIAHVAHNIAQNWGLDRVLHSSLLD